jgi:hypothetical protein
MKAQAGSLVLGGSGSRFLPGGALLLRGWLSIALLESRQDDRKHEFLFAMLIELDNNMFLVTGNDRTESEFRVFDLRALSESWFASHGG